MLIARATNKRVYKKILILNITHTQCLAMLVCVSYTTGWKYLTVESRYLDIVREEHWIWAYDNLSKFIMNEWVSVGKGERERRE